MGDRRRSSLQILRGIAGPMPLKFSLTRLLAATAFFAIPLALFSRFGIAGTIVAVIVGTCFSLITLTARASHIRPSMRIVFAAFLGLIGGLIIMPATDPPGQPGDEFRYSIGGVVFGCICGLMWNTIKLADNGLPDSSNQINGSNRDEQADAPKSP